jgi:hypothetical protein
LAAGGLGAIAASQIWRSRQGPQSQIDADETAITVAQRRGYREREAVQHLLTAIERVAVIEGRALTYSELLRTQNLRARAQRTPAAVPE